MSLEIVLGPMFSGKSSYVLSYVRKYQAAGMGVLVIKPNIDTRFTDSAEIVTHDNERIPCVTWDVSKELYLSSRILTYNYVVIEEAQFFKGLAKFAWSLLKNGFRHVLVVGLDGDANQKPFGEILECIPYATSVTKLKAMCLKCKDGTPAHYSVRKEVSDSQVDVGGSDKYLAVCVKHL